MILHIIVLAAALLGCAIGFKRFLWFLSIGYGLSVAVIGVSGLVYGGITGNLTIGTALGFIVLTAYGLRLGIFLLKRELNSKSYKKILATKVSGKEPPVFVKFALWLCVGVLYMAQTAGVHFRMLNGTADDVMLYVGIAITVAGAVIEAVSDRQKSAQKSKRPDMVATEGLFRICRCPNYFGEILVWTGVFLAGIMTYANIGQWITAVLGYICIVYVMVDGAKRLEKGQSERYGNKPEYQAYANKTPILIPLVPLYHLNKTK